MNRLIATSGFLRASCLLLAAALSTVLLSSCVSSPDSSTNSEQSTGDVESDGGSDTSGNGDGRSPIATALANAAVGGRNLRFDIYSLERHSPEILVLNLGITNIGRESTKIFYTLAEFGVPNAEPTTPNGVSLIDMQNNKRHMPLKLTDGKTCHCSDWSEQKDLSPGESIDIWAAYPAPPEDVELMTVMTPVTPDFLDIPITEAESPDPDIVNTPVAEPRILDFWAFQDDIDGSSSRSETGDTTSIMLSSDVLFELNESTLTDAADETLRAVAEEIDASSTTIVKIDGHTDNTGNDAINNPLSLDRAKAVEKRLKELITRDDITFEVAGHGSADPVADNGTEEGRAKNRRVTITFSK